MKYKLTDETMAVAGITLHRIECVEAFGDVATGEKGGWIEKEGNLSQCGDAWVYGDASVYGNARVYGNAEVYGNAWVETERIVTLRIRTITQVKKYYEMITRLQEEFDNETI